MLFLSILFAFDVSTYNRANTLFRSQKYEDALSLYLKLENQGIRNPYLEYNLGNTYYRLGQRGRALLHYERAYFLTPRDKDILWNLYLLKGKTERFENPFIHILKPLMHLLSFKESILLSSIFYFLLMISLAGFIIYRGRTWQISLYVFLVFFIFTFSVYFSWTAEIHKHIAVITANEVIGRAGPGEDYDEVIKVKDGEEVKILEEKLNYYLVQVSNGPTVWVKKEGVEKIIPKLSDIQENHK